MSVVNLYKMLLFFGVFFFIYKMNECSVVSEVISIVCGLHFVSRCRM